MECLGSVYTAADCSIPLPCRTGLLQRVSGGGWPHSPLSAAEWVEYNTAQRVWWHGGGTSICLRLSHWLAGAADQRVKLIHTLTSVLGSQQSGMAPPPQTARQSVVSHHQQSVGHYHLLTHHQQTQPECARVSQLTVDDRGALKGPRPHRCTVDVEQRSADC